MSRQAPVGPIAHFVDGIVAVLVERPDVGGTRIVAPALLVAVGREYLFGAAPGRSVVCRAISVAVIAEHAAVLHVGAGGTDLADSVETAPCRHAAEQDVLGRTGLAVLTVPIRKSQRPPGTILTDERALDRKRNKNKTINI